jgi:hypothetical protein
MDDRLSDELTTIGHVGLLLGVVIADHRVFLGLIVPSRSHPPCSPGTTAQRREGKALRAPGPLNPGTEQLLEGVLVEDLEA